MGQSVFYDGLREEGHLVNLVYQDRHLLIMI